ncbi:MAG TPA: glycosyltransferase family 4 protein [Acidimicrobiales bacterium]|nr:glycosyltransferase family 4 protein [Acidimicrobiales bacterium]
MSNGADDRDLPDVPGETVAKIGDLAASAGVRRVHVLAWRDLDDVEAGGSEIHIHEVARRWAAAGVEVTQRTSWAQGQPTDAMRDGYRVIRRAGRYQVFPRAAAAELLGRSGPRDVLLEIWNGMPFFSPLWNPGPRVVFLHHVHAEMWDMTLGPVLGRAGRLLERRLAPPLYRRSTVATPSESSKREIVDELGFSPAQVHVVPDGVDGRFSPGGTRSPHPLVVAVGRLVPVKRYDLLVRAAHAARRRVPNLRLDIVGEGYERPRIEAVVDELGARGWVTLHGFIDEAEKIDLYRRAWIVASASAREGWGLTLSEAAACGTPAVATRIGGHIDAVVDGVGGVLAPGDSDSLGEALGRVLADDELRRRLGDGARRHASELTWDHTAMGLMRVVADEVSRRRARRR